MRTKNVDNLSPTELKHYIVRGILHVEGTIPMQIEDTKEYKSFAKLKGKGIGVAEAGRKYSVPFQTISRWKNKGYIPVIGKEGKQKLLLDESYVAYCAHVYKQDAGSGKRPFDKNGTPYILKTISE